MVGTERIEIPFKKWKMVLLLFCVIPFVLAGIVEVANELNQGSSVSSVSSISLVDGFASLLFLVIGGLIFSVKMLIRPPGLIIDQTGITDDTHENSIGHIEWGDITDIRIFRQNNQQALIISVRNPDDYVNRQSDVITRKAADMNYIVYGTPIKISTVDLTYTAEALNAMLHVQFDKIKN